MERNVKYESVRVFKTISAVAADLSRGGIGKDQRNKHGRYNLKS